MKFPFQLLPNKDFDVVGFGTNAVDYLIRVAEYPTFGSKIELDGYTRTPGGEVASTMVGLQRLGMKTAYIGRFGGDAEGEYGLKSLIDEGIDISLTERIQDAKTQIGFILIDGRNGERTVLWQRDNRLGYAEPEPPNDAAMRGKILHITPHDTQACIRLARSAKKGGVIVSLDVDNVFDGIDELLPMVDICIASAEFPERLLGIADAKEALHEIKSRFGCAVTGLTLGASGSLVLCNDSFIETAGYDVPGGCVDTTGAGDAFRAGFLFGLLEGDTIDEGARIANAVAAMKCRGLGARTALPTLEELRMFIK